MRYWVVPCVSRGSIRLVGPRVHCFADQVDDELMRVLHGGRVGLVDGDRGRAGAAAAASVTPKQRDGLNIQSVCCFDGRDNIGTVPRG